MKAFVCTSSRVALCNIPERPPLPHDRAETSHTKAHLVFLFDVHQTILIVHASSGLRLSGSPRIYLSLKKRTEKGGLAQTGSKPSLSNGPWEAISLYTASLGCAATMSLGRPLVSNPH